MIKILVEEGVVTQEEVDKRKSHAKPLKNTKMVLAIMSGSAGLVAAVLVGSSQYFDFIKSWVAYSLIFFLFSVNYVKAAPRKW